MQSRQTAVLVALVAIGMFLLSVGGDSLKVAHLGIKFVPFVWLAAIVPLSYHTVSVISMVFGFFMMLIVQQICRRADKRVIAAFPEISPPPSFGLVLIAGWCLGLAGWWIADGWFRA